MKSKPKGAKYRNLTVRGGVIYCQWRGSCSKETLARRQRRAERMGASRYDDFDRLEFLIGHPQLTVLRD